MTSLIVILSIALISASAASWHMRLYIEDGDQITLAAVQMLSSKLYTATLPPLNIDWKIKKMHLALRLKVMYRTKARIITGT